MLVQASISGGSRKHKSVQLNAQRTVNFWPQKQDETSKAFSQEILTNFPGLKLWATNAAGFDRNAFVHKNVLYRVCGSKLFKVSAGGIHTELGTVSGSARCIFSAVSNTIIVVTAGSVYTYDAASETFQEETDTDFETPNSVTSINSQAIYDGDGGRFVTSNAGTAATINSLNYATLESVAQDLVRVYAKNQIAWLMGQVRFEPWWNSGDGNPPFARVESGIVEVGLKALHSVGETRDALYFYGNDDQVYILQGYNAVPISTPEMAAEFKTYTNTENAIGFAFIHEGKYFYTITFPEDDKTWIYPEGLEWFELESDGRWYGNSAVYAYGKTLIFDYRNGNIYELDSNTYENNSVTISRKRDTAPIHGGLFQKPGKRVFLNRLEFLMQVGTGLPTGQGSDPELMVSLSEDGGKTFGTEMRLKLGAAGEYQQKVELFNLGSFYNGVLRIEYSDPTPIAIYGMAADVEIGI